ncbi:hypothetical protein C5B42_00455 [Candidatus Cerribacteria bacterium 'Amazon FNV 2010 28 9']|uniref:PpiC domain-containing protein n=1 Tax=Candidatus Cerribacteria bacterium 'Amazon FNV 2010 28 9' TaxID=2081795 RepID=A0A317JPY9_9BACT|nr:MAG: hypothetical protein C5B42_00455 [Candidatus Cerribacteria bacterium 'Amazon FNV 2010 28 9']
MKKETTKSTATTPEPKAKKTVKKIVAKKTIAAKKEKEVAMPVVAEEDEQMMVASTSSSSARSRKIVFTIIAVLIVLGLAAYKFQYVFIPAKVNGKPIFIWQYAAYLHNTFGKDAIQTLTTQAIINQEIAKSGVTVSGDEIQKEVDTLDKQASASGGINAMLTAQGMTMSQLRDQIRIQLAVKKILKDQIVVTDAQVDDTYNKNKDLFKNMSLTEAKAQVRSQLEDQSFQKAASDWLTSVKTQSKVEILFPGLQQ